MIRLRDYNAQTILKWWASRPAEHRQDLEYVARMGETHQIDPRDLTIPKIRRHIRKLLFARGYLPRNGKPTDRDYQEAKAAYLEDWFNQDIL